MLFSIFRYLLAVSSMVFSLFAIGVSPGYTAPLIGSYTDKVPVGDIVPGADSYGQIRTDIPVVPALKGGTVVGWVFLTSDFVSTTGYSGKPIHTLVGIDQDAVLTGVRLVKHSEPIVLIGIPDSKIKAVTAKYAGLDLKAEAAAGGSAHDLDIISGATVTIMVIDDSIVRSGLKVARALGLGGLKEKTIAAGPVKIVDPDKREISDWQTLTGDGSVRRLSVDVAQINEAFRAQGDPKAIARPEPGPDTDTYIDMYLALVDVPSIGLSLLGEADYRNLMSRLKEGDHAIAVMGRGRYSFKGSGYVRGGIFDRIHLIQDDVAVRFHDRQHARISQIVADGAPAFTEMDLFVIPADSGFSPVKDFRLQLLVQRAIGAIDKAFLTFDLGYQLPQGYLKTIAPAAQAGDTGQPASSFAATSDEDKAAAQALWMRIWKDRKVDVAILASAIGLLTLVFFFQMQVTRHERFTFWFRIAFLVFTLVWLGWMQNAQLSVVNVLAFFSSVTTHFSWDAFLMDPLVFLLWFSVAAALLFWGRGAYCGWLCPFGALQELTNRLAKLCRIPQWELPWGLHERLWPLKYMIFLALFGLSLYSLDVAEHYAEVEPFKTAIILKFQRAWPFVTFVVVLLAAGLFVERFYCRYLCPLGAALAIPARLRMFDWLKRYRECGNPCQRCAKECMVQAIHPEGNINANECLNCLHCQVLYQHDQKCPVCIKKAAKRRRFEVQTGLVKPDAASNAPAPAE
ncbi:NosR/NirI family nitrous oxide reductase transcriptional regulator [Breoghania corrubedonensis]|uniref:NosR/NirI family nitrous oxide reductase transcriptional regulator n=1 Tax=Breoghania corrubedonensis TaxID=665038 RepID=A0A2T5V9W8_9HYPH|nr:NosR/NirI family nitrous oxide reductase transcriptional regulator [Breoghania corrubedonensis]